MKAVCWHGAKDVRVDNVPDPKILNPRDAILKVASTAICGSDLHLYDGYIPTMQSGDIDCFFCQRDLWSLCDNSNPNQWLVEKMYGHSPSGLFGYSH
jgi:threonine dehydrogenase-like Zn-dependent dehydrogenase